MARRGRNAYATLLPDPNPNPPLWTRFLFPSVSHLIFLALLISLSLPPFSTRLLNDAGTGWHIRNGQLILANHSITRTDPFSSTMQGQPWFAWEWLYDAAVGAVYNWSGLNGVVFLSALFIAAALTATFKLALKRGADLGIATGFLLLTIGASSIHFLARPHVLGWVLTVFWFYLLDSSIHLPGGSRRRLYWLPVLMLVWVNVHGGFLIGFVLLGFYIVEAAAESVTSKNPGELAQARKRLGSLGVIFLVSGLASLVNPYGYKLHRHIYEYLSNRFLMDHIDEFLSPNFHGIAQQCFAALLLLSVLLATLARTKPRLAEWLVIGLAMFSGLYAARNLPVSAMLMTLVITPLCGRSAGESDDPARRPQGLISSVRSFVVRMGQIERRQRGCLWPAIFIFLGAWIAGSGGRLAGKQIMNAGFSAQRFPVEACEVIAERRIREPVFTPDFWGGYVIYRLSPETKVVVDDRHDLYGEEFLKRYLKIVRVEPGWQEELRGVDWILVPAQSSLAGALGGRQGWALEYRDDVAVVYRRRGPV